MDTSALIAGVRKHPELYSKHQPTSFTIDQKNSVWKEIARNINQPVEKVKAKWRNLRDSYQKAIKRRQELNDLGKISMYQPYKHEVALSFLEESFKRKGSTHDKPRPKRSRETIIYQQFTEDPLIGMEYSDEQTDEQAVEYLSEISQTVQEESQNEEEPDQEDETEDIEYHEISATHDDEDEEEPDCIIKGEKDEQEYVVEVPMKEDQNDSQIEESQYQETKEPQSREALDLESWLTGVKTSLLSLTPIERAQAKRSINNTLIDFEIQHLEKQSS